MWIRITNANSNFPFKIVDQVVIQMLVPPSAMLRLPVGRFSDVVIRCAPCWTLIVSWVVET
jgi:muramidase (phage lysozyme)